MLYRVRWEERGLLDWLPLSVTGGECEAVLVLLKSGLGDVVS